MKPQFFADQTDFRRWLEENHQKEEELIVGFYKVGSGIKSMTWSESVDQALCFGWIDGRRNSIDAISYQIRFTPRRPSSIWSAVNVKKVNDLIASGQMREAGLAAFHFLKKNKAKVYSYENDKQQLSELFVELFKKNKEAWEYFQRLAPSYQKSAVSWVMSAKQEGTKLRRLGSLIADSEMGINQWKDSKYKNRL